MDFKLDLIDTKIEFYEAADIKALEAQIGKAVDMNKALMLDVHSVQHQTVFNHRTETIFYTAVVHFKVKPGL